MYTLTVFKNQYDNQTHREIDVDSWSKFEDMLHGLSIEPGQKGGKNSSPLISPAVYNRGDTRGNRFVTKWGGWTAIDVDEFVFHNPSGGVALGPELQQAIIDKVGDYYFVCYSTASSTLEHPKFRLVFPLQCDVMKDDIQHLWFSINSEIDGLADKQTKDLARMFYVPAQYPGAYNFFFNHVAPVMDPDTIMQKWPFSPPTGNSFMDRLPAAMREQMVEYRKAQMQNTDISWTTYRDCPFWPRTLGNQYKTISGTGWYHAMYKIMVALAFNAIERNYPITSKEIAQMCTEFDQENGRWYQDRPLDIEADRAIEYCYKN